MNYLEGLEKNVLLLHEDIKSLEGHNCPKTLEKILFEAERLNSVISSFRSTVQEFHNSVAETQQYCDDLKDNSPQMPSQIEGEIEVNTDSTIIKTEDELKKEDDDFWGDEDDEDFFACDATITSLSR